MIESVVTTAAREVASVLASWPPMQDFYLSRGTALAVQQGHRRFRDLGFFTRSPQATLPQLPGLNDVLQHFVSVEWTHRSPEQIDWRLNDARVVHLEPGPRWLGRMCVQF